MRGAMNVPPAPLTLIAPGRGGGGGGEGTSVEVQVRRSALSDRYEPRAGVGSAIKNTKTTTSKCNIVTPRRGMVAMFLIPFPCLPDWCLCCAVGVQGTCLVR
jgi:hypothetical protein